MSPLNSIKNSFNDGVQTQLNSPMISNTGYYIRFKAKIHNIQNVGTSGVIQFAGSSVPVITTNDYYTNLPTQMQSLGTKFISNNNHWNEYVIYIPPSALPSNIQYLTIINASHLATSNSSYIFIDDISIVEENNYYFFNPPPYVCDNNLINLSLYTNIPNPVFNGNGVIGNFFNPNNVIWGNNNMITCSYTLPNGCSDVLISYISKTTVQPHFEEFPKICPGTNFNLPGTSLNGIEGTWSPNFNNQSTTTYTFTPSNPCATIVTATIEILPQSCCNLPFLSINNVTQLNSLPSIPSNSIIDINADVFVTGNLSIQDCFIRFAPDVKVTVNPSFTLNINNSTLYSCSSMWNGIEVKDKGTLIIQNSRLEDAINAILSVEKGVLNIQNSTFNKNFVGINLQNYNVFSGISGCSFLCTNNGSPTLTNNLKAPFVGQKTQYGIYLNNNNNVTISGSLANQFNGIEVGVFAKNNGNVTIQRCNFTNINYSCPVPNACNSAAIRGWGIHSESNGTLIVGHQTNSLLGNSFTNSSNGIRIITTPNFQIHRNTFNNLITPSSGFINVADAYCIYAHDQLINNNVINNIQNNNFTNFEFGIRYQVFKSGTLNVSHNQFGGFGAAFMATAVSIIDNPTQIIKVNNNIFNPVAGQTGQVAIALKNAVTSGSGAIIASNRINNCSRGIWLTNYNNSFVQYHNSNSLALGTTFSGIYFPSNATNAVGILLENCQNSNVRNNFIQKAAPDPTSAITTNLYGIFTDMGCVNSIIQDNNVQRLGTGIQIQGLTNNPLQLKCNYMSSNMSGLTLSSTIIGNQGTSTNPQDNQWATLPSGMISGGAFYARQPGNYSQTFFFARSNSLPMFPPTSGMNPQNSLTFANSYSLTYNCSVACAGSGCPQAAMGMIANKEGAYSALTEEETKVLDVEVFKILKKNADYFDSSTNEGMEIVTYLDSLESTNAGNIYRFDEKIEARDTVGAYNEIANIVASTDIEQNFKLVNEIYWRTWFVGTYAFSPSDSAVLYDIAYQDPSYGGTAVFSARVMLGIDVENNSTRRSSNSMSTNGIIETKFVRFYPNPAKDYINYEITLEMNETAQLEISDVFGKLVFSKKIDYDSKTGFIDFKEKSSGFYTYKVKMKNKSATGKLAIE